MFEKEAEEYVNEEYDFCYYPEDNLSTRINAERDWQKGAEFGYNKVNEWHNLQKDPTDLPQCEEDEQIIFYVKEWYEDIQKHRNHYCLGFYKKAFLNDDVKVFVEKSKGYENEHLPATVLRWRVLETGD